MVIRSHKYYKRGASLFQKTLTVHFLQITESHMIIEHLLYRCMADEDCWTTPLPSRKREQTCDAACYDAPCIRYKTVCMVLQLFPIKKPLSFHLF